MIFRHGGRQREMGLGSASVVTLADARRRRDEAHRLIAEGRDPIAEKNRLDPAQAQAMTFGAFADVLVPELAKGFENEKHKAQWTSSLNTYAASLRPRAIAEITTDDVLAVLTPIWTTKSETASRVRGRIEKVLLPGAERGGEGVNVGSNIVVVDAALHSLQRIKRFGGRVPQTAMTAMRPC